MVTVTQRIRLVTQPDDGYIPPKNLKRVQFEDGKTLGAESIHPITAGLVVDCMSRYVVGSPVQRAFGDCLTGAFMADKQKAAKKYAAGIKGTDDESINNACKLVWYDQVQKTGKIPDGEYMGFADRQTCDNIRIMLARTKEFFYNHESLVFDGMVLKDKQARFVQEGVCDYVTTEHVWDLKVSVNEPTKEHTLQVMMYYLMLKHHTGFQIPGLKGMGIFNPRLNAAFVIDAEDIPVNVIRSIETDVMGYPV